MKVFFLENIKNFQGFKGFCYSKTKMFKEIKEPQDFPSFFQGCGKTRGRLRGSRIHGHPDIRGVEITANLILI